MQVLAAPQERRSAADEALEPEEPAPQMQQPAVAGVVVDATGRPVAGARLWLTQTVGKDPTLPLDPDGSVPRDVIVLSRASSATERRRRVEFRPVTSDAAGLFLVDRSRTADGGQLTVTSPTLLDHRHVHEVDPTVSHQVVELPAPLPATGEWNLEIVDGDGGPVAIRSAHVSFVARTVPGVLTPANRGALSLHGHRVVQRDLAPARWCIEVQPEHALPLRIEWQFEEPGARRDDTVTVVSFPDAAITQQEVPRLPKGELPWVDASSGLAAWLPKEREALGQSRGDRYFAATLQSFPGELLGATLRLHLRAVHAMSENDALLLDFAGRGEFRWQARIAALVPGDWSQGSEAHLLLDLAQLPLPGGGTLDGLSMLADGLLDVVVQDDTAVLAVTLDVVHRPAPR